MTRIKLAVLAGGALFATPVFAQGTDPAPPAEGSVEAGAGAEVPTGTGTEGAPADTGTVAPPMWWARSMIDRPYVLMPGKIAAYGQYAIVKFSFVNPITGMSESVTGDGFGIGGAYGVTDKITAGLQYAFTPGLIGDADSEIKGDLDLFGEFQIMHGAKMSVAASADFSLDLCGSSDMMGECVSTKALHAGLGARYVVAPKMAVFTGAPYGPGPVGQHLSISFEDNGPITFDLPVGFMFQATPELNVHLSTTLASIALSNSPYVDEMGEEKSAMIFGADYIPLSLGALFSVTPNIDVVGAFILPDIKEIGFDLFAFSVGARWYN